MGILAEQQKGIIRVYQAPAPFVAAFYGLLVLWTAATAPLIWQRFSQGVFRGDWLYGVMIGFFYLYTWYWSLGLASRISIDGEGRIELKSIRRTVVVTAKEVRSIQGSRFSGGFGFIRFKLHPESLYLFCHRRNAELDGILREIGRSNPLVKAVRV